ncbi:MAG: hypothetical protein HZA91_04965 [Verrucomicrobia bacterium]|nr:hypothetical protein [Verrucomicrobiota bacterium]
MKILGASVIVILAWGNLTVGAGDIKSPSPKASEAVITGTMPIKWMDGRLEGQEDNRSVTLLLAEDSDWSSLTCTNQESLTLLVCYIREPAPGSASRYLEAGVFKTEEGRGTSMQSVLTPDRKGLDFCFMGGNFVQKADNSQPEGFVVSVFGWGQLRPQTIKTAKTLRLRLSAREFSPTIKLKGKGRIAFVIQKEQEGAQRTVSNIVELPITFPEKESD